MKKYYEGTIGLPLERFFPRVTDKAIAVTISGGYTSANDRIMYLPLSQLVIGEPNEYGNAKIYIPVWLLRGKVDIRLIEEIESDGNIVEM